MTRPVHECEITACSGCGQEFSKAAGARERLCYGCWCKSHPCQVNGKIPARVRSLSLSENRRQEKNGASDSAWSLKNE